MTEQTPKTDTPPGVGTEDQPPTSSEQNDSIEQNDPNREAAKYRRRLQETKAERDHLRDTVTSLRRAEVERIAAATIRVPQAIWATGIDADDLLTDDGNVDPTKVKQAATDAVERLGLAGPNRSNCVPGEGRNPVATTRGDGMAAVIRGD